ncbi:MAG: ribonuclease Z [Anaerolineae bacterium]|nr:ribonuclease Z [Anaerolineae bacterium]
MPRLVILGSASAVSNWEHDNTHMALQGDSGDTVLIDCGSNSIVRLLRANIHHEQLTDLILTHFHPDHVHGVPILLMHMWQTGRVTPLRVHGLHHCLHRTEDMMAFFTWDEWPNFFPVAFYRLPEREGMLILDSDEFRITSSPTRHFNVPTIGLRIEVKSSGLVVAYSCDTAPCDSVARLAQGADLFIHEATGYDPEGHSRRCAGRRDCDARRRKAPVPDPLPGVGRRRSKRPHPGGAGHILGSGGTGAGLPGIRPVSRGALRGGRSGPAALWNEKRPDLSGEACVAECICSPFGSRD